MARKTRHPNQSAAGPAHEAAAPATDQPLGATEPVAAEQEPHASEAPTEDAGVAETAAAPEASADPAAAPAGDAKRAETFLVVKAKSARGRRRAGRWFPREETVIPRAGLAEDEIAALQSDHELQVSLRVVELPAT